MNHIIRLGGAGAALILGMAVWANGPAAAQDASAEALQKAMQKCAQIADAPSRHICSDAVLQGAGLLNAEDGPQARPEPAAPRPQAAPRAAEPAAEPEVATAPAQDRASAARQSANLSEDERRDFFPSNKTRDERTEEVNHIQVTLGTVRELGRGKYVLTDTDGVIWQQLYTRSNLIPPRAGQSMTVRKNALDGYLCRIEKTPSFRCKPVS